MADDLTNTRHERPQLPETEAYLARQREIARLAKADDHRFISPDERLAIWDAYLELGSYLAVSKRFNRDRETISRHIKCPEFEAYAAKVYEDAGHAAVTRLKQAGASLADDWIRASSIAADKGDHKPAKDALIATGVIQTDQAPPQQGIVIVNGLDPTGQALPNPFLMGHASPANNAEDNSSTRQFARQLPRASDYVSESGVASAARSETDQSGNRQISDTNDQAVAEVSEACGNQGEGETDALSPWNNGELGEISTG